MLHVFSSRSNLLSLTCVCSQCFLIIQALSLSTSPVSVVNATSASVDITTGSTPSVVLITIEQTLSSDSTSAHSLPVAEDPTSITITSASTTSQAFAVTTSSVSSSAFSSAVTTVQSSTNIPKSSSAFSTGSSKSLVKSTAPILASTAASSSISTPSVVASESSTRSTVATVTSDSSSRILNITSMSTKAPLPSIPIPPNSPKNNSPVVTLADQTPSMSSNKPSSSGATVSSHSSTPVVSTKEAAPPPASSTHSEPLPAPPSKPVEPPASTSSKSSAPIPSPTSSHSVLTTTSVVVVKGPLSQSTSTVTQTADTTLSSALVLTSTQSNGSKVVTTPALVTLMSTSTESDGALTTVTHVVANPPNLGNTQQLSSDSGPLHKQGVLAGICVVVGIVAATAAIGLIFCIRRQRRLNRRKRWLAGMQHQRPASLATDPFRDPQESYQAPAMRSVGTTHWDQGSGGSPLLSQEPMSHEQRNIFGGVSLIPDPYPAAHTMNTQNQARYEYPHAGIAYTTDMANPVAPFKRHSLTPSSPSIYPATLPPDDNERPEVGDFTSEPVQKESTSPVSLSTVPPRPPRSHLRESAKFGHYAAPLTPPESNSSHNSQPPSPTSDTNRPQDFLARRTLLDVRNR